LLSNLGQGNERTTEIFKALSKIAERLAVKEDGGSHRQSENQEVLRFL
jgi:hypothetical protein